MDKLDETLIAHILCQLSPAALAAAQATCKLWQGLVLQQNLWQPHACGPYECCGVRSTAAQHADALDARHICLHRAAAEKWKLGQLVLSASLPGHTATVTCVAMLQHILVSGSKDHTARVWDLQQGRQLHLLRHAAPIVAVALPSVSVAVTATNSRAFLWRQGKCIRSFDVMPGGSVTALALTDTRLLLGSSGGTVQQYDIFSGRQQLITRHSNGVTCLLTQQQQQPHEAHEHVQEGDNFMVLVGTAGGKVTCMLSNTGYELWHLPARNPFPVTALVLQPGQQHKDQQEQQQLLFVLNGRSELVCWHMPCGGSGTPRRAAGSADGKGKVAAAAGHTGSVNSKRSTVASSDSTSSGNRLSIPAAPLLLYQLQVEVASNASTGLSKAQCSGCLVCPQYGSSCVFFADANGCLTLLELQRHTWVSSESAAANSTAVAAACTAKFGHTATLQQQQQQQHYQQRQQEMVQPQPATVLTGSVCSSENFHSSLDRAGNSASKAAAVVNWQLHCLWRRPLQKLGQLLARRVRSACTAASSACTSASQEHSNSATSSHDCKGSVQHNAVDSLPLRVTALGFTASGRLAVGLSCGGLAIVKFRSYP